MSRPRTIQMASGRDVSWKRVDPVVRRQTWVQARDVTSELDGTFNCDIVLKEKDPSYQKPLTGGYSLTRAHVLKLQWQTNGENSGVFKRYFTYGNSSHDGSYFVDENAVKSNWQRVYKGFPRLDADCSEQIGVYRIWGSGAPPSTFLGNIVATLTVSDKYNCR